jgi:hypothetical protein
VFRVSSCPSCSVALRGDYLLLFGNCKDQGQGLLTMKVWKEELNLRSSWGLGFLRDLRVAERFVVIIFVCWFGVIAKAKIKVKSC